MGWIRVSVGHMPTAMPATEAPIVCPTSPPKSSPTGEPLWHSGLHIGVSNGPITYQLDGLQYVVVGAGDSLYGFVMQAR